MEETPPASLNDDRVLPTDLDVYGVPYGPAAPEPADFRGTGPPEMAEGGGPRLVTVRRLLRNRAALAAIAFLTLITVLAVFAPLASPHDPNAQDILHRFGAPSWSHPFGTDYLGRDILSRLIFGARVSLEVAYSVVAIALVIAVPIGLVSGYFGGLIDNLLMRVADAGLAFPPLVLALAVAGVLGPSVSHSVFALVIVFLPGFIRFTRGQTLGVRHEPFVDASRAIGTSTRRILFHRIFPNVRSALTVTVALSLGGALLAEAGLSFLGLGAQPPTASWGNMVRDAANNAIFTEPWQVIIPALAIVATVLAYNTLGDAIRDALGGSVPATRRTSLRARFTRHGGRDRHGLTSVHRGTEPVTSPRAAAPERALLSISDLTVGFATERRDVTVVDHLSLDIHSGEILGLVGESGSGKTVTALSVMRLIPSPPGRLLGGVIEFEGRDLLALSFKEMRAVRGRGISMVFQDPMTSLDPAFTVGNQLSEAIRMHNLMSRGAARTRAVELLELVKIPDPQRRIKDYPHALSGGMRQRVVLAIALAGNPKLLIADEPTTALDVTVQAEILDLLRSLQQQLGMSVLFVTHDLGVVAQLCDRVAVMYAGQIVEQGPVDDLFTAPRHPYTAGLLEAVPQKSADRGELVVIRGQVPAPHAMPAGCRFSPRCDHAQARCGAVAPVLEGGPVRLTRCLRAAEIFAPPAVEEAAP